MLIHVNVYMRIAVVESYPMSEIIGASLSNNGTVHVYLYKAKPPTWLAK